ncbi:pyrroline-5-carboxylate reductase family protein [Melioribacter sp. OK-6-Me]|uniref:pyrroline-5-carboxylate reductase family protein n=1 Tax=unclassified Melioribacter TaxID=2627329 RepID=UPI003ED98E50
MKNIEERKISFIGGGKISEVFISRLLDVEFASKENLMVSDVDKSRLEYLKEKFCIRVTENNNESAEFGDIVFLAVPPKQIKIVLSENCRGIVKKQLIISLAAAIPTWLIESVLCENSPVVRVIPNTPSQVGKGVNPYCCGKFVNEELKQNVQKILSVFGDAIEIDEELMNIATAVTAVGPTYWLPAVKSLLEFTEQKGFDKELANKLVVGTMKGTAELILQTMKDPDELLGMIGTRTINEEIEKQIFYDAVKTAYEKIQQCEKKLIE